MDHCRLHCRKYETLTLLLHAGVGFVVSYEDILEIEDEAISILGSCPKKQV